MESNGKRWNGLVEGSPMECRLLSYALVILNRMYPPCGRRLLPSNPTSVPLRPGPRPSRAEPAMAALQDLGCPSKAIALKSLSMHTLSCKTECMLCYFHFESREVKIEALQ